MRRLTGVLLLFVAGIAGCTSPAPPANPAVEVSENHCGAGWTHPHGGDQTIAIKNVGIATMEVELVDPATDDVYAAVEPLAPNTTRPMHVLLGRGRYAFACFPDGSDMRVGPAVTIADGPAPGSPGVAAAAKPVSDNDLIGAVKTYQASVATGIGTLAARVADLRAAIGAGDRGRAQTAWLAAQMAYSRLGAAYGTFGDAADAIDGLPSGLAGGVHDKDFTGLRRIEYGLWHGEALPSVAKVAAKLAADVDALRKTFATERTDPADLPLRAHEILENALQFELTGDADQGAGAGLAVISANVDGTKTVLNVLAPVLAPRYPGWSRAMDALAAVGKLVFAQHTAAGWTKPQELSRADHERLDGALSRLLEDLAPIAAVGEVRRTS